MLSILSYIIMCKDKQNPANRQAIKQGLHLPCHLSTGGSRISKQLPKQFIGSDC